MKLGFPTHLMVIASYFWSAKENQQREHWVSLACKSVWLGCKETTHFITRVTCLSSGRRKDCLFPSKLWTCTPGNRSSRCRRHLRSLGWSVITKPQRSATSRGWLSPCSTANPRSHPSASGVTTVFPSHAEVRIRAQSTATVRAVPCDWQSRQSALELRRNLKRIWRPKDRRRTFPSPPHKVCSFTQHWVHDSVLNELTDHWLLTGFKTTFQNAFITTCRFTFIIIKSVCTNSHQT